MPSLSLLSLSFLFFPAPPHTLPPSLPSPPPLLPGIPTSHNYTNTAPFAGLPPLPPLKPNVPPTKPSLPPTKPSVHPTKPTLHPTKPSQPPTKPSQPPTKPSQPPQKASSPPIPRPRPRKPPQEATYDNTGGGGGQGNPRPCSNDYDDPDALEVKGPSLQHTPHGDYDNPDDVIGNYILFAVCIHREESFIRTP